MPSPFPGMNPYIEAHWGDVHHSLITYTRDALGPVLPPDLQARIEERVFIAPVPERPRFLKPEIRVMEGIRQGKAKPPVVAAGLLLADPLIVSIDEEITQGCIEIRDRKSKDRLVTVVEFLSPANKAHGEGRKKYLQKRQELLDGYVSVVEIDLFRSGERLLPIPVDSLPPSYQTPYLVYVRRGWQLHNIELYRVPLRERLPNIRVPLRQTDPDAPLDLQALIDTCYRNGDYDADIDYEKDPDPPLNGEDARWADALLKRAGLRKSGRRQSARKKRGA